MKQDISKKIYALCFLLLIGYMFVQCLLQVTWLGKDSVLKQNGPEDTLTVAIAHIEDAVDDAMLETAEWIELYGLTQRLLNRRWVGKLFKDVDGRLLGAPNSVNEALMDEYADSMEGLYEYAQSQGIAFVYVQSPTEYYPGKTQVPSELANDNTGKVNYFLSALQLRGIPFLDTRPLYEALEPSQVFYKTDHHWTQQAAFLAGGETVRVLNRQYGFALDEAMLDKSNFGIMEYPACFLGSRGINVGTLYDGKEDFDLLQPLFETQLSMARYSKRGGVSISEGDFVETFYNMDIIENTDYLNKYNVLMRGANYEAVIHNELNNTGSRVLVITDSFGRGYVPFISLCFETTAFLDPSSNRYTASHFAYIDEFQPDVILVLFSSNAISRFIPY